MLKKVFFVLILICFANASQIKVAVAANVSFAINDLISAFHTKYPNVKVSIILGSSGKLNAQIKRGAPFDIFMSANMRYPQDLYDNGLALEIPKIYAQGELALFSSKPRNFSKGIKVTLEKSISRVAIANPNTAPYGKATVEALKNAKIYKTIKHKFIYAQSISQTVQYALTAADLGFISKSSLFSSKMKKYKKNKNWIELNKNLYTPIQQGAIIVKATKNLKATQAFYNFIYSFRAKKIFKKYGYQ
ncbi:MAG: molybdate ABC transporter substrate-binding protein [Campylobacteraceae bacterium]|nr:molybdate ABC transporter substrate-binding protein [Campylobacteraceae bacterium]